MTGITSHVLDTSLGAPARGLALRLERLEEGRFVTLATATTNDDGRAPALLAEAAPGTYRICFDTAGYFSAQRLSVFYPSVEVLFQVTDGAAHYHIPLLLSPFGYTTYRGS